MCTSCQMPTTEVTENDAFGDQLLEVLNHGALATMISIGHRTALFDTMKAIPPATSDTIAEAANLNERYVREWLGAMVTGGIVKYTSKTKCYQLPESHAAFLTRDAAPQNMAAFAQYIPLFGTVEDGIVRCFEEGATASCW